MTSIVAGSQHSLASKSDGSALAWGSNNVGQLGDGTSINRNIPVPVARLGSASGVTGIAAGNDYSLARKSDGSVLAWGNNNTGQLGSGTLITSANTPIPVAGLGAGSGEMRDLVRDDVIDDAFRRQHSHYGPEERWLGSDMGQEQFWPTRQRQHGRQVECLPAGSFEWNRWHRPSKSLQPRSAVGWFGFRLGQQQ